MGKIDGTKVAAALTAVANVIEANKDYLCALDSEVELAIQQQLLDLMEGKTVIAIAHRLSTIARMDRLVVLDAGRIVEQGSHAELLAHGGHYATLWRHQSGGFLGDQLPAAEVQAPLAEPVRDEPLLDDGPLDEMRADERPEPDVDPEPPPARSWCACSHPLWRPRPTRV